jgi:sorbitol/mannitol transport system substrate-binding protein
MRVRRSPSRQRGWRVAAGLAVAALVVTACGGNNAANDPLTDADAADDETEPTEDADAADDTAAGEAGTLNVAIVGNPQMEDIASLTPDLFTAETGIDVEYTILEEQTLREIVTRDAGAGGQQFDVVMIGMFEAPQFGANGWLIDLLPYAEQDEDFDLDDLIPTVREGLSYEGSLYASPFYAESSFVMYREDVLDEAGVEMPEAPSWDEIAEIARTIDSDEMAGICLRGKPGWGDLGAVFTTVINTFGATWWSANEDGSIGEAQIDQPEFREALEFYVDLVNDAGQPDAANASFNECLSLYLNEDVAMWYDATVAAGLLEADDSAVQGLNGYALAPTKVTDTSGWLWAWALAIPQNSPNPDAAWDYIGWATSADYIASAGEMLPGGWAAVPPGTRQSTYDRPEYQEAAGAFADMTLDAMLAAPIDDPGTTPRPGLPGVQFVGVPEFQDVGTRCTEQFSAAIAGSVSIDDALEACQQIASEVAS